MKGALARWLLGSVAEGVVADDENGSFLRTLGGSLVGGAALALYGVTRGTLAGAASALVLRRLGKRLGRCGKSAARERRQQ